MIHENIEKSLKIKDLVEIVLCQKSADDVVFRAIDELYETLRVWTQIPQNTLVNQLKSNGLLLSAENAASCMLGYSRTYKYWQALVSNVEKMDTEKTIRVCYPGCGPLATLILPLITMVDRQFEITLLDINQQALTFLEKTLEFLDLGHCNIELIHADATEYCPEKRFDLLILEVLCNGLANEAQVAITKNMTSYLAPEGRLIPEQIEINLTSSQIDDELRFIEKVNRSGETQIQQEQISKFRSDMQPVLSLDRNSHQIKLNGDSTFYCSDIDLSQKEENSTWVLTTRLVMDENNILDEYEDGITRPMLVYWDFHGPTMQHQVFYQISPLPGFVLKTTDTNQD
jgi:predicted RNA methylase